MSNIRSWPMLALAGLCLALVTGYGVEKVLRDGVTSWALFATVMTFPLLVGVLIHLAIEDLKTWSWRILRAPIALALALTGLAVTMPASIGSSGQARDNAIAKAQANNQTADEIADELKSNKANLKWAKPEMIAECSSGEGKLCKSKRATVTALEARNDFLLNGLAKAPVKEAVTPGETRIVWAAAKMGQEVTEADVQAAVTILPPLAAELFFPFFLAAGLGKRETKVSYPVEKSTQTSFDVSRMAALPAPELFTTIGNLPTPPKVKRPKSKRKAKNANAIAWVREQTLAGNRPKFSVVRGRHRLSKSSASRALAEGTRLAACA